MVDGFDFDVTRKLTFYEACPQGKQHQIKFPCNSNRADELLGLAHKMCVEK